MRAADVVDSLKALLIGVLGSDSISLSIDTICVGMSLWCAVSNVPEMISSADTDELVSEVALAESLRPS
jgi:hypothetical protein